MNIDKYVTLLKSDIRVTELQAKNVVTALYLNQSIKEDGCKVTKMLINDLIATIKDKKKELFSLPDNVPVICKQILGISIITKPKQSYDIMLNAFN